MPTAVFYISGHGYGHAARMAEVIRRLARDAPGWTTYVCTTAPAHLLSEIGNIDLHVRSVSIDAGIVEDDDALSIDAEATIERLGPFFHRRTELVDAEAEFVHGAKVNVIVADIPHLAGEIGARAGVPVLGIGNFTWDFIYEPLLATHVQGRLILQAMKRGYDCMRAVLRLPFHHDMRFACRLIDIGLITVRSDRDVGAVLQHLGIGPEDTRRRVYVGWRDGGRLEGLRMAAEASADCIFLYSGGDSEALPENTRQIRFGPELSFPDIATVSEVVISKLGYGTLAACVAGGADLLYPPRLGFREDTLLRKAAARYLRAQEIPIEDFRLGRWRPYLEQLKSCSPRSAQLPLNGAADCARMIIATAAVS